MDKYYVISVWCDVSSELHGPYKNEEDRTKAAIKILTDDSEYSVFRLTILEDGTPVIGDFANYEIEVDYEEEEK